MRPISMDIGLSGGSPSAVGMLLTGRSLLMEAAREQLRALAAVPWHGRIEGPRGAGKWLAAGLVHRLSRRGARPFVRQSMSALVRGLEFGRLFGWSRGGFTGAVRDVPGVLEEANQGTLFLDEIAWARRRVQGALLQLLEDGEVVRIGERRARKLDVRFLFGTNVDLDAETAAGRFPADLLDRMGALVVRMPALKDHPRRHVAPAGGDLVDGALEFLDAGVLGYEPGGPQAYGRVHQHRIHVHRDHHAQPLTIRCRSSVWLGVRG